MGPRYGVRRESRFPGERAPASLHGNHSRGEAHHDRYVTALMRGAHGVAALDKSDLLALPVAEIPKSFRDMETLRKKGKLTQLPESLLTLGDVKAVAEYFSFRSRVTLTAPNTVDVQVPWLSMLDVSFEMNARKVFGTRITVRSLGFWDHLFLWTHSLRSDIPTCH